MRRLHSTDSRMGSAQRLRAHSDPETIAAILVEHGKLSLRPYEGPWTALWLNGDAHDLKWKLKLRGSSDFIEPEEEENLRTPTPDAFGDPGATAVYTVSWDFALPDGTNFADAKHLRMRHAVQEMCFLVRTLPSFGITTAKSHIPYLSDIQFVTSWMYRYQDIYNPDRFLFSQLDEIGIHQLVSDYIVGGAAWALGYPQRILRVLYANAIENGVPKGLEQNIFNVPDADRKKICKWLQQNDFYEAANARRKEHVRLKRTAFCGLAGMPAPQSSTPKFSAFARQFEPELLALNSDLLIPASGTRTEFYSHRIARISEICSSQSSFTGTSAVMQSIESIYRLRRHIPSLCSADVIPRFKPIRKYISDNTDTPGHTPLIPLPLSLGYAQAALELIVNSGEELVRFYLAGTRHCQENKLFSIKSSDSDKKETLQKRNCWVIDNVPQSLQALGLSCWGSVFAASGKSPYTKLRTAPGLHDIIDVLLGAIVYLIVSVCPLRAAEIISLTVGDLYLLEKDGYWLARGQHKRNVNDFLMDKARPIPNVVASAFSMAKQLSDGLRELMNLKTHEDGRVLFFVPAANRSAHLSARRITRSRLESCLERFCDYCGFPVDPLGRRWYVRPHEIRKSFLINFFYCTGFGGLDATRWMAGHADLSTIFAYLKTNLPREHLVEVEAALAYEELWNVENNGGGEQTSNAASLYSDVCRRFGVRKISAVKKNDLERFILEAFKGDLYEVEIVSELGSSAESVAFVIRSQNGRQRR
ncbi:site-specific integrase [Paraburkholderia dilworthii]|uniref:site-specific integrase n=1 Tax=Paraburkholderia dilworthii TaxID=948106 RepID=UPI00040B7079|nr:site-specific integrase [Paraburkholderia dilworthii]